MLAAVTAFVTAIVLTTVAAAAARPPIWLPKRKEPWTPVGETYPCPSAPANAVIADLPEDPPQGQSCSYLKMTVSDISTVACPVWGGTTDDIDDFSVTWSWGLQPTDYELDPYPTQTDDFVGAATVDFDCIQ